MIECPRYIVALLQYLSDEMETQYWNTYQKQWGTPFGNYGNHYYNDTFKVNAYYWGDCMPECVETKWGTKHHTECRVIKPNFKYKDIEIVWYKYLGRGTEISRKTTPKEAARMFEDCMDSISKGNFAKGDYDASTS